MTMSDRAEFMQYLGKELADEVKEPTIIPDKAHKQIQPHIKTFLANNLIKAVKDNVDKKDKILAQEIMDQKEHNERFFRKIFSELTLSIKQHNLDIRKPKLL